MESAFKLKFDKHIITILIYLAVVMFANVITASTHPLLLFGLIIPWGSWFIGITFVSRDIVQMHYDRLTAYCAIGVALVLSGLFSYSIGDPVWIAIASAIAFCASETSDTEVFTRLHLSPHIRVWWSGLVSGFLDSSIFVIVGLSPMGAGFIPWSAVPIAIVSQILVKTVMVSIGYAFVRWLYKCKNCYYTSSILGTNKCILGNDDTKNSCAYFKLRRL